MTHSPHDQPTSGSGSGERNEDPSPDEASQETSARAENAPDRDSPDKAATIVGIGASAGGLSALKEFFHHVPIDTGLAYVVVIHLSPEHESHLAELLQPHVKMPVQQVNEETALRPDHVYVIPPNANLSTIDTHLRLSDLEEERRERAPIDHFFRTLAQTHDGHAVAVVLTGTGADGTLGLKEIKAQGGLTIVQDPTEAEYDGMPQSAISTGLVDFVLPIERIPPTIFRYAATQPRVPIPESENELGDEERQLLHKVFAQLRARTGRDFSRYKRSTILRRIRRRMQLRAIEELSAYLAVLREEPQEVHELADDLLVTVTNFFRDVEVFETLEREVVPQLFDGKEPEDDLRVWSVGCATGEEAYSLAILLLEEAARREREHGPPPRLQVFASDLHEHSLQRAREGFYPGDIATDVSAERLKRFFVKEDGGFRIRREVREMVVFAPHNLLSDPPFSKLDLVACRNVMIYLQRDVQQDVVDLFHYALRPDGFLVLGTSETIDRSDLFRTEDKKACVYRKRNVPAPEPRLPVFPLIHRPHPGVLDEDRSVAEPVAYGMLHQQMVERYAPPSLLVSPDDNVVHLSEHAGRFLVHPGGELTSNAFKLVRKEFRVELRSALLKARQHGEAVRSTPLRVQFNGHIASVVLDVRPAYGQHQEGFCLVIFDERGPAGRPARAARSGDAAQGADRSQPATSENGEREAEHRELEAELDLSQQRLQAIIEEYETGQEELKASNEELQSSNEELRSTLEELETSKEELQSMNEELQTVNQENRHKVEELAQLTGDLQSLMAATDIATLFLDRELRIMRFTPRIGELFNVRPADRGRPLSDFTHQLGYDELEADARRVLDRLAPVEREVEDDEGRWYLTRVLPYRSVDDRIEGVVITFVDITSRIETEEQLLASEDRRRFALEAAGVGDWVLDLETEQVTWSSQALALHRLGPEATASFTEHLALIHPDDRPVILEAQERATDPAGDGRYRAEFRFIFGEDEPRWISSIGEAQFEDTPEVRRAVRIAGVLMDITEQHEAEQALRESEERYRLLVESATEYAILMLDPEGRIVSWSRGAERIFGYAEPEIIGRPGTLIFTEEDRTAGVPEREMETALRDGQASDDRWHVRKGGERFWASGAVTALRDEDGRLRGFAKVLRDNTERKQAEDELRWLNETLEARVRERTEQVRELASTLAMAEQDERRRIAQILHDDLQQLLFGIQLKMTFVHDGAEVTDDESLAEHAEEAERFLDRAIQVTRELTVDLSPPVLAGEGLTQTLEWLTTQMEDVHGLAVEILAGQPFVIKREGMRVLLFQIVRELLFNVVKHADTDRAVVTLAEDDGSLIITVEDEGAGFDPDTLRPKTDGGFGLFSVRERLRLFGGHLKIDSVQGEGTRMTATVPAILLPPDE